LPEFFVTIGGIIVIAVLLIRMSRAARKPHKSPARTTTARPPVQQQPTAKVVPLRPAQPAANPNCDAPAQTLEGTCYVIDGDTIVINKTHIRLWGIDAPEMEHPWGKKAKWALVALCKGQKIRAELDGSLTHDRCVAKCYLPDGTDLSAEMVKQGMAIDWPKFSGGVYTALEPEGIRKRHWRAAARQKGNMRAFNAPVQPRG
jgi:endonuclease YncB( thermonuclease family)